MNVSSFLRYFFILIFSSFTLFAQKDTPFTAQQKMYVKGNSVLIGNTVLGKHPEYAFDEVKVLNDEVPLIYVDIDEDTSTFSSSGASFTLPQTTQKIKYAALYWGGLYPAQSSSKRNGKRRIKYKYLGERDPQVQEVKLKVNDTDYQDVIGQVIYDSKAKGPFAKESPYACYADVTAQLSALKDDISITVANIRATTGFIEGGAAAGWLLYVVYEDDTQTPKYFTSYAGFKEVSKEEVEVVFQDLQPKNENTSSSKIMMAALEGDTRIKGDALAIYSDIKENFISLTTEGRPFDNFFNSTISVGYDIPTTRTPASKNTLGFDLLKMNVPDSTITVNTTDAIIKLRTAQDRFYTFFLAFETEIETVVFEAQTESVAVVEKVDETIEEKVNPPVVITPETTVSSVPVTVVKTEVVAEVETPVIKNTSNDQKLQRELYKIANSPSIASSGEVSGYYLVTNVFQSKRNATRWKERLNKEGYNARTFINNATQATYVYIESSETPEQIQSRKEVVRQIPHLSKTWICRVN